MSMTAEAIKAIQDKAVLAEEPHITNSADGRSRMVVVNGEITTQGINPLPRDHVATSLEALIDYVARAAGLNVLPEHERPEDVEESSRPAAVVWHDDNEVVAVLNDRDDGRDRVTLWLTLSRGMKAIMELDGNRIELPQKELIRLLRVELGVENAVVTPFRKIDWLSNATTKVDKQIRQETMGHEVNRQASGVDELPEEISVSIPVYDVAGEREPVTIRLVLEYGDQVILCVPRPGDVQRAFDQAQKSIRDRLNRLEQTLGPDVVPVYRGRP